MCAQHDAAPDTQLHVRGVGEHEWDGTPQGFGMYEDPVALMQLFAEYGGCRHAYVRHRISEDGDRNTSWALVTMETTDGARLALSVAAEGKVGPLDTLLWS